MAKIGPRDVARCPSGLYRIDAAQREQIGRGEGPLPKSNVVVVDGEAIHDRATFFAALAKELRFPDYFGHNWDAVYDCLTDPSWLPEGGLVLVLDGFTPFAARQPEQWQIGLKVLRDAADFWRPLNRSFFALLHGDEALSEVDALPASCFSADNDGA